MNRAKILFSLALLLAGGAAFFLARGQSLQRCRRLSSLVGTVALPMKWVDQAGRDHFWRPFLRQGKVAESLRAQRARASEFHPFLAVWHLSIDAKARAAAVAAAEPRDTQEFLLALGRLGSLELPEECRADPDPALLALQAAAQAEWDAHRQEVRLARAAFRGDQEIFCQSDRLIERLRSVLRATQERCDRKKQCPPALTAGLEKEIADIEQQKEFNRQKLGRKWPPEILGGLKCS